MGEAAKAGKDKLTCIAEDYAAHLGPWLEQQIAESSGKEGKGILPIEGEPILETLEYPADRLFVYLMVNGEKSDFVKTLAQKGYPLIEITIQDPYQLAMEFYRWEYATAVALSLIHISEPTRPY